MAWKRKSLSSLLSLAKHFIWWMNRFWTHQFSKPEAFMSKVILQTQWTPDDFIWRDTETRSQWNQAKKTTPLKKTHSFYSWIHPFLSCNGNRDGKGQRAEETAERSRQWDTSETRDELDWFQLQLSFWEMLLFSCGCCFSIMKAENASFRLSLSILSQNTSSWCLGF